MPAPKALSTSPNYGGFPYLGLNRLEKSIASTPVRFIVGHDGEVFFVHADTVARLSVPLHTLLNDSRDESGERYVDLKEVDKDIFLRFVQFAYTGVFEGFFHVQKDGSVPKAVDENETRLEMKMPEKNCKSIMFNDHKSSLPNQGERRGGLFGGPIPPSGGSFGQVSGKGGLFGGHTPPSGGSFGSTDQNGKNGNPLHASISASGSSLGKGNNGSQIPAASYSRGIDAFGQHQPDNQLKRKFEATTCGGCPSKRKRDFVSGFLEKYGSTANGRNNDDGQEASPQEHGSSKGDFINYVRIWAFADSFAIDPLRDCTSLQLANRLSRWSPLQSAFVPDFGGLVRYVYNNPRTEGSRLRQLIAAFAACMEDEASSLEGWLKLLEDVPAFAADMIVRMTRGFDQ